MRRVDDAQPVSKIAVPWNAPQAFADLLGDPPASPKSAVRTARLIEDQFLKDGWPLGRAYGRGSELAQRYDIGQAVTREAVRILEARGTGRMRTGRNAGLEVTAPPRERLSDSLGDHCDLVGASRGQIRVARSLINRVAARLAARRVAAGEISEATLPRWDVADGHDWSRGLMEASGNPVIAFFMQCMDSISTRDLPDRDRGPEAVAPSQSRRYAIRLRKAVARGDASAAAAWANACLHHSSMSPPASRAQTAAVDGPVPHSTKLAVQIAANLLRSLAPGQWRDGRFLGSEDDLCERYEVGRRSMRQAIRILEAGEVAVAVPGRGHGLMACSVKPTTLSRLLCCHLAAENIAHHDAFEAYEFLSVETIAHAARHAAPWRVAKFAEESASLRQTKHPLSTVQQRRLEEQQFALADNPVLEIFLCCARAYPTWDPRGRPPQRPGAVSDFSDCAKALTDALINRDVGAAATAQARKFAIMKSSLDRTIDVEALAGHRG